MGDTLEQKALRKPARDPVGEHRLSRHELRLVGRVLVEPAAGRELGLVDFKANEVLGIVGGDAESVGGVRQREPEGVDEIAGGRHGCAGSSWRLLAGISSPSPAERSQSGGVNVAGLSMRAVKAAALAG